MSRKFVRVLLSEVGSTPPREFRLFKAGINPTSKGDVLFDLQAAEQVMNQYQSHGTDLMIDLEHDSLSDAARAMRSDAGNAVGWFQLAVKPDGSLWAINVRWNPEGMRRLTDRTQRYTSPAFTVDESGRPTRLVNCALCAMPATLGAQPLVAASRGTVIGARVDGATLAAVNALAQSRGVTKSRLLIEALTSISSVRKLSSSPEAASALKALIKAIGLPPDVDSDTLVSAIKELFVAAPAPEDAIPADPAPDGALETADPPAQALLTQLSVSNAPPTPAQAKALIEASAQGRLRPASPREHITLESARRAVRRK